MQIVGQVTLTDIDRLDKAGLSPKQVHDRIVAEAGKRYPGKTITVQPAVTHRGFHIVAL